MGTCSLLEVVASYMYRLSSHAANVHICNDEVSSDSFLSKLGIRDLDVVIHISRMRWFGHVERSTGWIAEVRKTNCSSTEETRHVKEYMG